MGPRGTRAAADGTKQGGEARVSQINGW